MKQKKNSTLIFVLVLIAAIVTAYVFIQAIQIKANPPPVIAYGFSMYQAVRVIYTDGSDSWKYPQSRTYLTQSLAITEVEGKVVNGLQAFIFFNYVANSTENIDYVNYTCYAKLSLYDASANLIKDFCDWRLVSYSVANPKNNTDSYVISATISATDFQKLYNNWVDGAVYNYVITCKDIKATLKYKNGLVDTCTASGIQATKNQLWWQFKYATTPEASIVNTGIEWVWK